MRKYLRNLWISKNFNKLITWSDSSSRSLVIGRLLSSISITQIYFIDASLWFNEIHNNANILYFNRYLKVYLNLSNIY